MALRRRIRCQAVFGALIVALCIITVFNINWGSVGIPVKEIIRILFFRHPCCATGANGGSACAEGGLRSGALADAFSNYISVWAVLSPFDI